MYLFSIICPLLLSKRKEIEASYLSIYRASDSHGALLSCSKRLGATYLGVFPVCDRVTVMAKLKQRILEYSTGASAIKKKKKRERNRRCASKIKRRGKENRGQIWRGRARAFRPDPAGLACQPEPLRVPEIKWRRPEAQIFRQILSFSFFTSSLFFPLLPLISS